jgi:hypothetical protein
VAKLKAAIALVLFTSTSGAAATLNCSRSFDDHEGTPERVTFGIAVDLERKQITGDIIVPIASIEDNAIRIFNPSRGEYTDAVGKAIKFETLDVGSLNSVTGFLNWTQPLARRVCRRAT